MPPSPAMSRQAKSQRRSHGVAHAVEAFVAALVLALAAVVGGARPGAAHLVGQVAIVRLDGAGDGADLASEGDDLIDDAK